MRKGFVITLDALTALLFLLFAMMIISAYVFHPLAPRGVYLKQLSMDVAGILDKTDRLDVLIEENNSADVREIIQATPESVCMQLKINDKNGDEIAAVNKFDCGAYGKELQVTSRVFVYDGDAYTAKIESWYGTD